MDIKQRNATLSEYWLPRAKAQSARLVQVETERVPLDAQLTQIFAEMKEIDPKLDLNCVGPHSDPRLQALNATRLRVSDQLNPLSKEAHSIHTMLEYCKPALNAEHVQADPLLVRAYAWCEKQRHGGPCPV